MGVEVKSAEDIHAYLDIDSDEDDGAARNVGYNGVVADRWAELGTEDKKDRKGGKGGKGGRGRDDREHAPSDRGAASKDRVSEKDKMTFNDYQEQKKSKDKSDAPRDSEDKPPPNKAKADVAKPDGELVRGKDDEEDDGAGTKKKSGKKKGNQGNKTVIRLRG